MARFLPFLVVAAAICASFVGGAGSMIICALLN